METSVKEISHDVQLYQFARILRRKDIEGVHQEHGEGEGGVVCRGSNDGRKELSVIKSFI